jgi:hypothetical protein
VRQHAQVLFPTQEQVAVMSLAAQRLRDAGVLTAGRKQGQGSSSSGVGNLTAAVSAR